MDRTTQNYLYGYVKKLDLVQFIENKAQVKLTKAGARWCGLCPMPNHKDTKPSFFAWSLPDGVWLYKCFGCGSTGTIIDFCMDFLSLEYPQAALLYVAEEFDIRGDAKLVLDAIRETKVMMNVRKKLECEHIQVAYSCQMLLRSFSCDKEVRGWVADKYKQMNRILAGGGEEAIDQMQRVGVEADAIARKKRGM